MRRKQVCGVQFYRQKPIGKYIVDFYCPAKKLVIEIDGGGHFENGDLVLSDRVRQRWLESQGLCVVRFTNDEVFKNMEAVMCMIYDEVGKA